MKTFIKIVKFKCPVVTFSILPWWVAWAGCWGSIACPGYMAGLSQKSEDITFLWFYISSHLSLTNTVVVILPEIKLRPHANLLQILFWEMSILTKI